MVEDATCKSNEEFSQAWQLCESKELPFHLREKGEGHWFGDKIIPDLLF